MGAGIACYNAVDSRSSAITCDCLWCQWQERRRILCCHTLVRRTTYTTIRCLEYQIFNRTWLQPLGLYQPAHSNARAWCREQSTRQGERDRETWEQWEQRAVEDRESAERRWIGARRETLHTLSAELCACELAGRAQAT